MAFLNVCKDQFFNKSITLKLMLTTTLSIDSAVEYILLAEKAHTLFSVSLHVFYKNSIYQ